MPRDSPVSLLLEELYFPSTHFPFWPRSQILPEGQFFLVTEIHYIHFFHPAAIYLFIKYIFISSSFSVSPIWWWLHIFCFIFGPSLFFHHHLLHHHHHRHNHRHSCGLRSLPPIILRLFLSRDSTYTALLTTIIIIINVMLLTITASLPFLWSTNWRYVIHCQTVKICGNL